MDMIGPIDHVYYWTAGMDAAVSFYQDIVGLTLVHRAGDEWAEFEAGPVKLALHGSEEKPVAGGGTVVFRVQDLDGTRWALERRGVVFDDYVGEVDGLARFATFHDPDGNPVQIIEYRAV
jgi:catechol 2,3-dioxygenase-like lactoylglutathione lyase family enzyme